MTLRKTFGLSLILLSVSLASIPLHGGQDNSRRGRKYKAPPATAHIEVSVVKASNGKPIVNAAVVFHSVLQGKDDGYLEVKTNPEGKAIIDVIPIGSALRVQVIASGYATFGQDYTVETASKEIAVSMVSPRAQVSAYEDTQGEASHRKAGVQEPKQPEAPKAPLPLAPQ